MYRLINPGREHLLVLARLQLQTWKETYQGVVPGKVFKMMEQGKSLEQWEKIFNNPHITKRLLLVEEEEAGFVTSGPVRKHENGDCELHRIYLLKKFQGRALGNLLLWEGARNELQKGARSMIVRAIAVNPARKFYKKHGASFVKEDSINIGGKELREYIYCWSDISELVNNIYPLPENVAHNL